MPHDPLHPNTEFSHYQFQWWALSLIDARPVGGVEKRGIVALVPGATMALRMQQALD